MRARALGAALVSCAFLLGSAGVALANKEHGQGSSDGGSIGAGAGAGGDEGGGGSTMDNGGGGAAYGGGGSSQPKSGGSKKSGGTKKKGGGNGGAAKKPSGGGGGGGAPGSSREPCIPRSDGPNGLRPCQSSPSDSTPRGGGPPPNTKGPPKGPGGATGGGSRPGGGGPSQGSISALYNSQALPLPGVHTSPPPERDQLVNLPTWFWVDDASWAPQSVSASVDDGEGGTYSVTTTAHPRSVSYDMGNGDTLECGQGTPYDPSRPERDQHSDCSYTYLRHSADQPGQRYTVTATMNWEASWSDSRGGGGALPPTTTTSTVGLRVAELQAINTG